MEGDLEVHPVIDRKSLRLHNYDYVCHLYVYILSRVVHGVVDFLYGKRDRVGAGHGSCLVDRTGCLMKFMYPCDWL